MVPVTVTVTLVAPLIVGEALGLKLQESPEGRPGQLRFTVPLNPFSGVMVICIEPLLLEPSVTVAFEELIEKSAAPEGAAQAFGASARLVTLMLPRPVARS